MSGNPDIALQVEGLHVELPAGADRSHAVENVSFDLRRREIVCLVGESGSGKSITARAIMGLLAPRVVASAGRILFGAEDLLRVTPERLRAIRGADIAMIFQEPMTALNPLMTIGRQIDEVLGTHTDAVRCGAARAHPEAARGRAPAGPGQPDGGLSAPALGRPAAAGDDRDGADPRPEDPDRRRADHRARRDDAGADPAADPRAAGRAQYRRAVHHA